VNATEGAAYGAALLASVGCAAYSCVEGASKAWIRETEQIKIGANHSGYQKNYKVYKDLYHALKTSFSKLTVER
jgi:xylulokinase